MKQFILKSFLTLSLSIWGLSNSLFAQEINILDGFIGTAQTSQVQLRWTITSGETCNGTVIERSSDKLNWTQIGEIAGVCGSSAAPVSFNFIDSLPLANTINHYRLELGGRGYSHSISVAYYNFSKSSFVVIPNPVVSNATIFFEAKVFESYTFTLYDLNGRIHISTQGEGNSIVLNTEKLQSGTYFFIISRPRNPIISGKIIKI